MPIIAGKARWIKLTPEQAKLDFENTVASFPENAKRGPQFSMQLVIDEQAALAFQKQKLSVSRDTTTGEPFITLRNPMFKKYNTDEEEVLPVPKVVDENLNPLDPSIIGNDSPVLVDYWISTPKTAGYKKSFKLNGVQVDTRTMNKFSRSFTTLDKPLGGEVAETPEAIEEKKAVKKAKAAAIEDDDIPF